MIRSLISALQMYSQIPTPRIEWNDENKKYALGFFPIIGIIIGFALLLWRFICNQLHFQQFLFGAGATMIPIVITGGIHLDGFADVTDARASFASREKKLEIMSDPHIGSFAAIKISLFLLIHAGFFSQITDWKPIICISTTYILSRAFSAFLAIFIPSAKNNGSLYAFVKPAHKINSLILLTFWIIVASLILIYTSISMAICYFLFSLVILLHFRTIIQKEFGGISGDMCGWFLQHYELIMLIVTVFIYSIQEAFI